MELEQLTTSQRYSLTSDEDNNSPREKQERACNRWNSITHSMPFSSPLHVSTSRPWFYMFHNKTSARIVYDTEIEYWRHVNLKVPTSHGGDSLFPVASSGGLICLRSDSDDLIVCNPLSGASRLIPLALKSNQPLLAISMHPCGSSYGISAVCGSAPYFLIKMFSQSENCWRELMMMRSTQLKERDNGDTHNGYFLQRKGLFERSMSGRPRSHMIHWPPTKEFSGLTTQSPQGHQVIYFLDATGCVVACDTGECTTFIFPDILPQQIKCSLDLVRCGGRILLVVLAEMMESANVRVWEFSHEESNWRQVAAMPPAMSHKYYGKRADINCVGHDQVILLCVSSSIINQVVMCSLSDSSWVELPEYFDRGLRKRFVCAHSFEPTFEAIP